MELLGDFNRECGEYLSAFEIVSQIAMALVLKNIPNTRLPGSPAPYYVLIELDAASKDVPLRLSRTVNGVLFSAFALLAPKLSKCTVPDGQ